MSASVYSRASAAWGASTRCTECESVSALASTFGAHSVCDNWSQPASRPAPIAVSALRRKRRRSVLIVVLVDRVTAGDDRAQLVACAAHQHLEDVDQEEGDETPRQDEMDRACRLPAADQV